MQKERGFTLIEMSIVLVVIGLIIGGILMGQDLIKAARLRKVMSTIEQFSSAVYTFKTKYNGIPGDLPNAGDYWPLKNNLDPYNCVIAGGGDMDHTCNGDGTGVLVQTYSTGDRLFFNHLSLAGLIPGKYGNIGGQGWTLPFNNDLNANYRADYVNYTEYFNQHALTGNQLFLERSLPYNDILSFDKKFDDGDVGYGNVRSDWNCYPGVPELFSLMFVRNF